MSTKSPTPRKDDQPERPHAPAEGEPGSNAVEHEPDPDARPIPDGQHKYIPRSPFTAGNR